MCQFIESLCCQDGEIRLSAWHQKRVDATFATHLAPIKPLDLNKVLTNPPALGKYKGRIVYGKAGFDLTYTPYTSPVIHTLQLVYDDEVSYEFKSLNRNRLTALYEQRQKADDIIIIRNGQVTDSYYANLAFYDGKTWWTPKVPLLNGVQRQYLLSKQLVKERDITVEDLNSFETVSIINAMNALKAVQVDISQIAL